MIREKTTANETMLGEEIMGKFDATLGVFAAGLLSIGLVSGASADEKTIRIGVMNDMSGPYADFQGAGSVVAAKLAVEDYGGKAAGLPVEIISGDHLNKPDVGSVMAREWFDTKGVDAIADLPNSAVALAVNQLIKEKNKVLLGSGVGTDALTGAQCSPNAVQWTYDTYELGHAVGHAVVQRGGKTWYFITADYAFGHSLQDQAAAEVTDGGGKVLGSVAHPLGAPDFASFVLQAQGSGAQVVALADAGADETNAIKQAVEFSLTKKQNLDRAGIRPAEREVARPPVCPGADDGAILVLGPERQDPHLREALSGAHDRPRHAKRYAGRHVHDHPPLPKSGRQSRRRNGRQEGGRGNEGHTGRRPSLWQGIDPGRWPRHAPGLSDAGEDTGGIEGRLGSLQSALDDPGRRGLPAIEQRQLPLRRRAIDRLMWR